MTDGDAAWLLLHGTPLTPHIWDGVRRALVTDRTVHAPPLPAVAAADGGQRAIAERVLATIGNRRLHVVGHSFGGQVAIEVALVDPSRVASLAIVCSRASPFPAFAEAAESLRHDALFDVEAPLSRWFMPDELAAGGPLVRYARDCVRSADRLRWADDLDAIARYDRSGMLESVEAPAMVIAAQEDPVGTPDEMRAIADALPRAELAVLPDASHMSPFLDPARLAAQLNAI